MRRVSRSHDILNVTQNLWCLGAPGVLNGLATTPISNRGCQPALYGEGLAALVTFSGFTEYWLSLVWWTNSSMSPF